MEIKFNYEYECGGHTYTRTLEIDKDEFENDILFMLVCSYMQTWGGYPGMEIDQYLHNKFPNTHTYDDMYGHSIYNVYSCEVEGLKPFGQIVDGVLGLNYTEGEEWMKAECAKYNNEHKGNRQKNFSIWNEDEEY